MKMSDALRGGAETAPIEDVHVSTSLVRSRARRSRALRAGANGIVGVGAAALVVAGVMGAIANQTSLAAEDTSGNGKGAEPNAGVAGAAGDAGIVAPGLGDPAINACGTELNLTPFDVGNVVATTTVTSVDNAVAQFNVTYSTDGDGSYTPDSPTAYVVWDGLVVGTGAVSDDQPFVSVTEDKTATAGASVELTNCWDEAALPAGDYTLFTVTPLSADVPPVAEPTGAPATPSATPSATASDPNTAVSSDASTDPAVATRVFALSEAQPFTIPGEPVDNPFDQYLRAVDPTPLPTAPAGPAGPDDALTPEEARAAYSAALTNAHWDMAPGTQRVVLTSASDDPNGALWAKSYYGCPTDGASASFPAESADLHWLDVIAHLPSSIHVSYGWVVDGNPVVGYGVKNQTDWSLPGFYDGSTPRLVLVKSGRVVAEAYPVNPDQSGGGIAYAADGIAPNAASESSGGRDSLIWAPAGDGYLAPGESLSGDYLWRDLNGCWTADGASVVTPGTYTVLTAQDIYVGGQYPVMENGGIADGAAADTSKAVAPAPDAGGNYASFQVWTSLGTVSVSN